MYLFQDKSAVGVGDGQGNLECRSPPGRKELDMTATKLVNSDNLGKYLWHFKGKSRKQNSIYGTSTYKQICTYETLQDGDKMLNYLDEVTSEIFPSVFSCSSDFF